MDDRNNTQLKKPESSSALQKFQDDWKVFFWSLFRPLVIIPLVVTVVALIFANSPDYKSSSLVLQIVAVVALGLAGGFFYDSIKSAMGNSMLTKKGLSAVRNLSLARSKTKNISERAKVSASTEEISNLLSLLEKDIATAILEWNDIFPGIGAQEEFYALLAEKEAELEVAAKEKEQLNKRLEKEQELGGKEKQALGKKLVESTQRVLDLEHEIKKLQSIKPSLGDILSKNLEPYDYISPIGGGAKYALGSILGQTSTSKMICSKCKKEYTDLYVGQLLGESLCLDCRSKGIVSFREHP